MACSCGARPILSLIKQRRKKWVQRGRKTRTGSRFADICVCRKTSFSTHSHGPKHAKTDVGLGRFFDQRESPHPSDAIMKCRTLRREMEVGPGSHTSWKNRSYEIIDKYPDGACLLLRSLRLLEDCEHRFAGCHIVRMVQTAPLLRAKSSLYSQFYRSSHKWSNVLFGTQS